MKGPYIKVIEPEEAEGRLKEIYDETLKKRGALAAVHKIHSLNPETLAGHMGFYIPLMFGKSPLHRRERELIGVAVSAVNGCPYCVTHHSEALARYEKRPEMLKAAQEKRWDALGEKDAALCRFAEKLTRTPGEMGADDVGKLREMGFEEQALLDAAQVAAYFNFVNRMVLGLGVRLEGSQAREGCRY